MAEETCGYCGGSGYEDGGDCGPCNGEGWVEPDKQIGPKQKEGLMTKYGPFSDVVLARWVELLITGPDDLADVTELRDLNAMYLKEIQDHGNTQEAFNFLVRELALAVRERERDWN